MRLMCCLVKILAISCSQMSMSCMSKSWILTTCPALTLRLALAMSSSKKANRLILRPYAKGGILTREKLWTLSSKPTRGASEHVCIRPWHVISQQMTVWWDISGFPILFSLTQWRLVLCPLVKISMPRPNVLSMVGRAYIQWGWRSMLMKLCL